MVHRDMREGLGGLGCVTLAAPRQLTPLCLAVITWYSESLDILALCLVKEYDIQEAVEAVAEELQKCRSSVCVGKGIPQPPSPPLPEVSLGRWQ